MSEVAGWSPGTPRGRGWGLAPYYWDEAVKEVRSSVASSRRFLEAAGSRALCSQDLIERPFPILTYVTFILYSMKRLYGSPPRSRSA